MLSLRVGNVTSCVAALIHAERRVSGRRKKNAFFKDACLCVPCCSSANAVDEDFGGREWQNGWAPALQVLGTRITGQKDWGPWTHKRLWKMRFFLSPASLSPALSGKSLEPAEWNNEGPAGDREERKERTSGEGNNEFPRNNLQSVRTGCTKAAGDEGENVVREQLFVRVFRECVSLRNE